MTEKQKGRLFDIAFSGSFLLVFAGWFRAHVAFWGNGAPLILRFDDYSGITQIGGTLQVAEMGTVAGLIVLLNWAIGHPLWKKDRFLASLMAAFTCVFAILIFIAFAAIIAVN